MTKFAVPGTIRLSDKPVRMETHTHKHRKEPVMVQVPIYRGIPTSLAREFRSNIRRDKRLGKINEPTDQ
jgi:hypothetical protein